MANKFAVLSTAILSFITGSHAAKGQACSVTADSSPPLVMIGSVEEDSRRRAMLQGGCHESLIRSPISLSQAVSRLTLLGPDIALAWNSTIPVTMNDGALWAGRGLNALVTVGARKDFAHVTVILAPELAFSQNRGFPIVPSSNPARSSFASPWHEHPVSADVPLRFGSEAFAQISPGQSTIEAHTDRLAVGFTTENQWWGPGIRNAIVMSNNAPGFPRAYVRTRRPWETRLGSWEARIELGQLSKSRFLDATESGARSLSAGVVTLRTALDSGLTLGGARAVYAPITGTGALATHWADVFWRWNQRQSFSYVAGHRSDQISSLFFQWVIPDAGVEAYGEWARLVPIRSMRDIVVTPQATQGFTIGWQWLTPVSAVRSLRIQAEATMLEQTPPVPREPVRSFYTSDISPAGYTQRGQVIGAAIGPGSSSQFLAFDLVRGSSVTGIQLGRIRWEDEAYYRQPTGLTYRHHDVSLFAGARGARRFGKVEGTAEIVFTQRNNFQFQSNDLVEYDSAFDMRNVTVRITATPLISRPE